MSMSQQKISQAKLLQQVREASFALIDLGLFLDTHPRDEKAMDYFNRYQQQKRISRVSTKKITVPFLIPGSTPVRVGPGFRIHGHGKEVVNNVDL